MTVDWTEEMNKLFYEIEPYIIPGTRKFMNDVPEYIKEKRKKLSELYEIQLQKEIALL